MTVTESVPEQRSVPRSRPEVMAAVREIGAAAEPHAARHDREGTFVEEGYEVIRSTGYGLIGVPRELGGGGHGLGMVCRAQAALARYCANTALAIAMHQHNVLTFAWRWRLGDTSVEPTLRRIVDEGLILSSSGSADPTNTGVTGELVDGGVRVTGRKRFVSGVSGADVVLTMAVVKSASGERQRTTTVLVPTTDPGFAILPEWDAMGMRGSASNPVTFTGVFVPSANVIDFEQVWALDHENENGDGNAQAGSRSGPRPGGPRRGGRPGGDIREAGHRLPGLQIALPVIASVYLGAAGGVRDRALRMAAGKGEYDPAQLRIAGLLTQEFRSAWWALDALIAETTDESLGSERHFTTTMLAKRQVVLSSIRVVELAMELLGSKSYMRGLPFEQALRDVRAGITHPLSPEKTLYEIGKSALDNAARRPEQ